MMNDSDPKPVVLQTAYKHVGDVKDELFVSLSAVFSTACNMQSRQLLQWVGFFIQQPEEKCDRRA